VFLFDAFMIPGTAISATHIRLLRGNGDVPWTRNLSTPDISGKSQRYVCGWRMAFR
jgi:hypothetical protein